MKETDREVLLPGEGHQEVVDVAQLGKFLYLCIFIYCYNMDIYLALMLVVALAHPYVQEKGLCMCASGSIFYMVPLTPLVKMEQVVHVCITLWFSFG